MASAPGDDCEAAYLNGDRAGDDAVDGGFRERVELSIGPAHELRLQQVPAPPVQLEDAEVQLHGQICNVGDP